jgi:G:T-mismatch repair DNA endonuclease (very short patch repair protein)
MKDTYTCPACKRFFDVKTIQRHFTTKCKQSIEDWWEFALNGNGVSIAVDYSINEFNIDTISTKYKISQRWVRQFLFNYKKFKRRTISETRQTKGYKEKHKQTCLKNYGVENPSKSEDIKQKKRDTKLLNYGYINNFCNQDIQKKAQSNIDYEKVSESIKKTCLKRYNVVNPAQLDSVKTKLKQAWDERKQQWSEGNFIDTQSLIYKSCKFSSKLEKRIQPLISEVVSGDDLLFNCWVDGVNVDIYIPSKNIVIDINGNFWHANPKIYNDEDVLFNHKGQAITAKGVREKDKKRVEKLTNNHYNVFVLWEDVIKASTDSDLLQILTNIVYETENSKNYKYSKD